MASAVSKELHPAPSTTSSAAFYQFHATSVRTTPSYRHYQLRHLLHAPTKHDVFTLSMCLCFALFCFI
jgi:hypothetical protein